jgi:hypothetical protein
MKKKVSLVGRKKIIVLLLIFVVACETPATLIATPTPLLPTTSPTQLETPQPTRTRKPTYTPPPLISPEYSEPTIPPATISAEKTAKAASKNMCDEPSEYDIASLSPDEQWIALQCGASRKSADHTNVFRLDGTAFWKISFYETYGKLFEMQDGRMMLYHWSNDNQFAYFIPSFCCLDVPQSDFFNYFRISAALYRLDLTTGKVTTTLAPSTSDLTSGYAFAFSPNDKYLVYRKNAYQLSIYALKTGEIENIDLKNKWLYGGFAWATDSNKLAFVTDGAMGVDLPSYDYYFFQIGDVEPRRLIETQTIYRLKWLDDDRLFFNASDLVAAGEHDTMLYDLLKNTFVPIPTPTPQ